MKVKLNESPVGVPGRTSRSEAEVYVKNNPHIIKQFKKIVQQLGGKTVAAEILNLDIFGKPAKKSLSFKIYKQPGEE